MQNNASVWMHLGASSFHRAHQAWYLHKLIQQGDDGWSIALGNVRSDVMPLLNALAKQHGEYVLETVSPDGQRNYEKITSIRTILNWDEKLSALIKQGCDEKTKVIAFTVTEAGYYLTPDHQLNLHNPDIQADLQGQAKTLYGGLNQILSERMRQHGQPVTLLSCDNVRHNGDRFRHGFLSFLQQAGNTELYNWVRDNTTSPNTMVDRITPHPTPEIAERVKAATGIDDKVPIMAESFIQWVIEDNFIAGRPALENVGVTMVDSVLPWEEAKIRILNASHSCFAWAGTLIGSTYIYEDIRLKPVKQMAWNYVSQDVIPSLQPSPLNLDDYRDTIFERLSNPYIKDTNQRVAADSMAKLPGFITPTLVDCYNMGRTPAATAVLPGLFFLYLQHWAKDQLPYDYNDSLLDKNRYRNIFVSSDALDHFISNETLFSKLAKNRDFHSLMRHTVDRLQQWLKNPEATLEL